MAQIKGPIPTAAYPSFEPFDVERREVIAHIEPSPVGTLHPLAAAFQACGQYFAENDDMAGISLDFTVWDRTFHAVIDPMNSRLSPRGLDDDD